MNASPSPPNESPHHTHLPTHPPTHPPATTHPPTRSVLLRMMRSAYAICSAASFTTPSGFSSSRCSSTCLASTCRQAGRQRGPGSEWRHGQATRQRGDKPAGRGGGGGVAKRPFQLLLLCCCATPLAHPAPPTTPNSAQPAPAPAPSPTTHPPPAPPTHQGDHAVQLHAVRHRGLQEEGLDDGRGLGQPRGLDHDAVKLGAALVLQAGRRAGRQAGYLCGWVGKGAARRRRGLPTAGSSSSSSTAHSKQLPRHHLQSPASPPPSHQASSQPTDQCVEPPSHQPRPAHSPLTRVLSLPPTSPAQPTAH